MSDTINFHCPNCGNDLIVKSSIKIESAEDIEGTTCTNCGQAIRKDDIIKQARDYAQSLVRDMLGKHLR
ncbi:ECs_2282 family putative zinc-binding protein [Pantoea allii]|uniref:ECs_2282 family putative zinc-binding protein n=1 Tax=Pantoea allii TaxID=574096 RepID=UPI0024B65CB1|nr:hypothetical protein [Pantoea allii]MDJ0042951.1 hypothetical protein [Pantoea allii]